MEIKVLTQMTQTYLFRYVALLFVSILVIFTFPTFVSQHSSAQTDFEMELLIPLYNYPTTWDDTTYIWDDVAAGTEQVGVTVIVNPNNGPDGGPPNSDYTQALNDLRSAGVTLLGYIYTDYGNRDINEVKGEIDLYEQHFNIDGIFFDEAANSTSKVAYYEELLNYIYDNTGLDRIFINPGTNIGEGYFEQPATDTAVIFENNSSAWLSYQPEGYMASAIPEQFGAFVYSVPDADTMRSHIDLARQHNIQFIYLTDDGADGNPWDELPSFWQEMLDYLEESNVIANPTITPTPSKTPEPLTVIPPKTATKEQTSRPTTAATHTPINPPTITATSTTVHTPTSTSAPATTTPTVTHTELSPTATVTNQPTNTPTNQLTNTPTNTSTPIPTPTLAGELTLSVDLTLEPESPTVDQSVTARFTIRNDSNQTMTLAILAVDGRGPNCTEGWECMSFIAFGHQANVMLAPGQEQSVSAQRSFSEAGDYFVQVVYQDNQGSWHHIGGRIDFIVQEQSAPERTTVSYTPSDAIFTNPERGFYHYLESRASAPTAFVQSTLEDYRTTEQIALAYCIHYLDDFTTGPISTAFLAHIQANLDTIRDAGLKCILRFAYTDDDSDANQNGLPDILEDDSRHTEPSQEILLGHIEQLRLLLRDNSDVIAVMQAGFIGIWGEWYYSDHFADPSDPSNISQQHWTDRRAVLDRLLDVLPSNRMVQVRYPALKQELYGVTDPIELSQAYTDSALARIGYHNDALLNAYGDQGTFRTEADRSYMAQETQFLVMGGETNQPENHESFPGRDCSKAMAELTTYHWSFLNIDYYTPTLDAWDSEGCLDEMKRLLGYSFVLHQGEYTNAVSPGNGFSMQIELSNQGLAAPFNPRDVELILRNQNTGDRYYANLPTLPRAWFANDGTTTLDYTIGILADMPLGQYDLLLYLPAPEASLYGRPAYSIRMANQNLWESNTGYNRLNHTVSIQANVTGVPYTGNLYFRTSDGAPIDQLTPTPTATVTATNLPSAQSTATPTATATEVSQAAVDFQATHLEVTQAIQDLENSVRLVADKRTFVRLHGVANSNGQWTTATLRVQRGDSVVTIVPLNSGGGINMRTVPNRAAKHHAFLFELPSGYRTGNVTLTAEINPNRSPVESDYTNNILSQNIAFETVPPLDLVLYTIGYGEQLYPSQFHQNKLIDWLQRAYPLSRINVVQRSHYIGQTLPSCGQVNAFLLNKRTWDLRNDTVSPNAYYYGMVSDAGGVMRGCAAGDTAQVASGPAGSDVNGWDRDGSYADWYGAHELAHLAGRSHADFCGAQFGSTFPYSNGQISPSNSGINAIYGFDASTQAIYTPHWKDLMTYCPYQWISDFTYEGLMDSFLGNGHRTISHVATRRMAKHLIVTGIIEPTTGQVTLEPIFILDDSNGTESNADGTHAIVLRNGTETELGRHLFTPTEMDRVQALGNLKRAWNSGDKLLLINELIPYVDGTVRVNIERSGAVLHSVQSGASTPTVKLLTPQGGEMLSGDKIAVSWEASDSDDDLLWFNIQYSADNGQSWEMVAQHLSGTTVELDAMNIASTEQGLFRIWVSDGIHTSSDTSDAPFGVPNRSPTVEILQPQNNAEIIAGQTLILSGYAYDINTGTMPDSTLQWISSVDGLLGNGLQLSTANLSIGPHILTLHADDSRGATASSSVQVVVLDPATQGPPADELVAGPSALIFDGDSTTQVISIDNINGKALAWAASTEATWLRLDQTSGTTPADLAVSYDMAVLTDGDHSAQIVLSSSNLSGMSIQVDVLVSVSNATTPIDGQMFIYLPMIQQ